MKVRLVSLLACLAVSSTAHAASYVSPVTLIGGAAITFEGFAESTLIGTQFLAGSGVTFSQPDGGRPQIDNSPFLFFYNASSGTGVLTGSTEGGAAFPTIAGMIATFNAPVSQVEAFMSDTAPLGNYTVTAFGAGGVLLETLNIPGGAGINPGAYVGFNRATSDIVSVRFGPGAVANDAFAIDDLRFARTGTVPDAGSSVILLAMGLVSLVMLRRKDSKS